MILVYLARALTELSFYHAFASILTAALGSAHPWAALLLPCGCFAASALLQEKKKMALSWLTLIPMAVFAVIPGVTWIEMLVYLPPCVYVVLQIARHEAVPDRCRMIDIFSLFWKVYIPVMLIVLLLGGSAWLTAGSLVIALVCCVAGATLLRTLRHAAEVQTQWPVQMMNLLALGGVLVLALVFSLPQTVAGFEALIQAAWQFVISPIIMAIAAMASVAISWVYFLFKWLLSIMKGEFDEIPAEMSGGEGMMKEIEEAAGLQDMSMLFVILRGLGILALVILVVVFFVWIARRTERRAPLQSGAALNTIPMSNVRPQRILPGTPAGKVRAQYRRFLRLCRQCGVTPVPSSTSLEVTVSTRPFRPDEAAAMELRELYLSARYASEATPQDVQRAKQLIRELTEQMKPKTTDRR